MKRLSVRGVDLHVLVRGSGMPLVLVHAFPLGSLDVGGANRTLWLAGTESSLPICAGSAPAA